MVQDNNRDPLEFNDGIGDMLQDKSSSKSKWWKTPLLSILSILIIIVSFFLSFHLGKSLFLPKKLQKTFVPQTTKEPQFDKLAQEFTYKEKNLSSPDLSVAATKKTTSAKKMKEKPKVPKKETNFSNINYKVIVGTFSAKKKASQIAKLLLDQGFSSYIWKENNYWKVQIGSFKHKENAKALKKMAEASGHTATIISK